MERVKVRVVVRHCVSFPGENAIRVFDPPLNRSGRPSCSERWVVFLQLEGSFDKPLAPQGAALHAKQCSGANRCFSSKALLRQPGSFEGVLLGAEHRDPRDLSVDHRVEGSEGAIYWGAAPFA